MAGVPAVARIDSNEMAMLASRVFTELLRRLKVVGGGNPLSAPDYQPIIMIARLIIEPACNAMTHWMRLPTNFFKTPPPMVSSENKAIGSSPSNTP
jgi:hypothetical protein